MIGTVGLYLKNCISMSENITYCQEILLHKIT